MLHEEIERKFTENGQMFKTDGNADPKHKQSSLTLKFSPLLCCIGIYGY